MHIFQVMIILFLRSNNFPKVMISNNFDKKLPFLATVACMHQWTISFKKANIGFGPEKLSSIKMI